MSGLTDPAFDESARRVQVDIIGDGEALRVIREATVALDIVSAERDRYRAALRYYAEGRIWDYGEMAREALDA